MGLENQKKRLSHSSHQILLKAGMLLYFSRCYTVVRRKLKLGLSPGSRSLKFNFSVFIHMHRPTLTYAYQRASLQHYFRDYYLLRNASKLDDKNRSYTFSKFDISLNWPSCSYTFNRKMKTKHNENFKLWQSVDNN